MIIHPKIRGFICTTSHPVGCSHNVKRQADFVSTNGKIKNGPKNVLIIGASTGYGLASWIVSAIGCKANTLGIFFEKEASESRPATPGFYNAQAISSLAKKNGLLAETINGDAFSHEIKEKTVNLIKEKYGKIDCVIYSLASPVRKDPFSGEVYRSALKPIDETFTGKSLNADKEILEMANFDPASYEEIESTIKVMGGEDWELWMQLLLNSDVLADNCQTVAYSYIGPEITWAIYKNGTIGRAKEDIDRAAVSINNMLSSVHGKAYVSVNKAVVTQASSAIPVVPLYISILFKIMKEKGIHEGCIEQIYRLFSENIYGTRSIKLDDEGRIRLDDLEMQDDVQAEILNIWEKISTDNLNELSDLAGYKKEFLHLFGFGFDEVDYDADVNI